MPDLPGVESSMNRISTLKTDSSEEMAEDQVEETDLGEPMERAYHRSDTLEDEENSLQTNGSAHPASPDPAPLTSTQAEEDIASIPLESASSGESESLPASISALPAPIIPRSMEVWEPPSPTAWRKSAFSHAGAAVLGAVVTLLAVKLTLGFTPTKVEIRTERPLLTIAPEPKVTMIPGQTGINGMSGTPGTVAPGMVTPNGVAPIGPAAPNSVPAVPGGKLNPAPTGAPLPGGSGTPLAASPQLRGTLMPPPVNIKLPPLTSLSVKPGPQGFVPIQPGVIPKGASRPPIPAFPTNPTANPAQKMPGTIPSLPKVKGVTAPPVKVDTQSDKAAPASSSPSSEDVDAAISSVQKSISSNPRDPMAQLQLEKLYRKKLIGAERVDEMERYRSLADDARDKARALLNDSGKAAPKPANPGAAKSTSTSDNTKAESDKSAPTDNKSDKG